MNYKQTQRTSSEERLLTVLGQFLLHINNINTFYETTKSLLEAEKDQVHQSLTKAAKDKLAQPETQNFFGKDKCDILKENKVIFDWAMKAVANRTVRMSSQMIESATLVFTHTILDELISECCSLSFDAAPSDWEFFVKDKKIEIKTLRSATVEEIIQEKSRNFVQEKINESIIKRFKLLNQLCIPKLGGDKPITTIIDLNKLEEFDQLRHKIIHGQPFAQNTCDVKETINFASLVGTTALMLVGKAYNIFDGATLNKEALLSKYFKAAQNDIPEYKDLIANVDGLIEYIKIRKC